MVNAEVKTPNKKRKSLAPGAEGTPLKQFTKSPKHEKTPGKQHLGQKSPEFSPKQNQAKTTPQINNIKSAKKQKRSSESEFDSPPKKMKMFAGTTELENNGSPTPKKQQQNKNESGKTPKQIKIKDKKTLTQNENTADKPQKHKKQNKPGKSTKQLDSKNEGASKTKLTMFGKIKKKINEKDETVIKKIDAKIQVLESRTALTKTAKRKLKVWKKLKSIAESGETIAPHVPGTKQLLTGKTLSKTAKRRLRKQQAVKEGRVGIKSEGNTTKSTSAVATEKVKKGKKGDKQKSASVLAKPQQKSITIKQEQKDSDEDSSESDYNVEESVIPQKIMKTMAVKKEEDNDEEDIDEDAEEEEESGDEEESDKEMQAGEEASSDDDEEEVETDNEDDDEEDASSGEEPEVPPPKSKKPIVNGSPGGEKNKKRFVLFVGNLPYSSTKQQIQEHFKKCGNIKDIRIPNDSKTDKPRGFAYVEVENEVAYQKALSLHHSQIEGRRINVQYSEGGKKKGENAKNNIKQKNFKLQAMRKQGQLAGNTKANQKRRERRNKAQANN